MGKKIGKTAKEFSEKASLQVITDNFTIGFILKGDMDAERWAAQQEENKKLVNEHPEIFKI